MKCWSAADLEPESVVSLHFTPIAGIESIVTIFARGIQGGGGESLCCLLGLQ